MANWSSEAEAREEIKELVAEYYHDFKEKRAYFSPGAASPMHPGYSTKRRCRRSRMPRLTFG